MERTSTQNVEKINRITVRMLGLATVYFSTDFLLLLALCYAGVVGSSVVIAFGVAGCSMILLFYGLIKTGVNRRFRDPGMATGQVLTGAMIQIGFLIAAPAVGIIFLVNLFSTFMFGLVALDSRQFRRLWVAVAFAIAIAFYFVGDRIGFPNSNSLSRILMCALFILTLGQSVYLAGVISNLRLKLAQNNQALATALETVEEIATRDPLTNVPNRRALIDILKMERLAYQRHGQPFCIAMLDIDHFKQINDRFGHTMGDKVLRSVASIAQRHLRPTDRIARYGGDEFVLVLTRTADESATAALERVCSAVARYDWPMLAPRLGVTVSIGFATIEHGEQIEPVFERADSALYAAKASGRNRVHAAQPAQAMLL